MSSASDSPERDGPRGVDGPREVDAASVVPSLASLTADATAADGSPPFSDQALVEARSGEARLIGDADALAILRPGEAELVVRPAARRAGRGTALLRAVIAATEAPLAVWSHGDHPGARRLAEGFGFAPTRRLLQQRAEVPAPPATGTALPAGTTLSAFRPGVDDADWLDLNARAFAHHPEQGSLTQADLDARIAEEWFDADSFLLLRDGGGALVAFAWLKVEPGADSGEFYAVGVSPEHQGEHLGSAVVDAGLDRLAALGIGTATLYVEGDNDAALGLYASRGFTDDTIDVQYTLAR